MSESANSGQRNGAASIGSVEEASAYRLEDFLRDPSMPSRLDAAEPWGDAALTLDIPGGPYAFAGLDATTQHQALEYFSSVVRVSPAVLAGSIVTRVRRIDHRVFQPTSESSYLFEFAQPKGLREIDLVGWRLVARLVLGNSPRGDLGVARVDDLIGMGDLENYLRFLAGYSLLAHGGLLIHSACVVYRGGAYLFVGRSGAGKTTMATLALEAGLQVLSDDMNALTPGMPHSVRQLPFAGTLGRRIIESASYPLRAVCWLSKGERVVCARMTGAQAVSRLAVCAPYVNTDPQRAELLLEFLGNLMANVPMLSLTFPRQADVVPILDAIGRDTRSLG